MMAYSDMMGFAINKATSSDVSVKSFSSICNAQSSEIEEKQSWGHHWHLTVSKFPIAPEGNIIEKLVEAVWLHCCGGDGTFRL